MHINSCWVSCSDPKIGFIGPQQSICCSTFSPVVAQLMTSRAVRFPIAAEIHKPTLVKLKARALRAAALQLECRRQRWTHTLQILYNLRGVLATAIVE